MPCDTVKTNETPAQRQAAVKKALTRLETALTLNQAKVTIGPNGAVAFTGWKPDERDGVTDVCAYRTLTAQGSWALRQAVARAEGMAGRKVNPNAVAAGVHSHDGGKTWNPGH